jgi:hypothetical protein
MTRNSVAAVSPCATICITAPVNPVTLSVAMPSRTTPMCEIDE